MFKKEEFTSIFVATLILSFSFLLGVSFQNFGLIFLMFFLIIGINVLAKKIMAYYFDSKIEIKLWEINRYGFKPHQRFNRSFQAGIFLPIITRILFYPLNGFLWLNSLVFDIKPEIHRAAKRHGLYTFTEENESHTGMIAATGIYVNLLFAFIGYLINQPEFTRLNLYYAFFNILPLSDLDGNKVFFGSLILWTVTAIIILLALSVSFFVI